MSTTSKVCWNNNALVFLNDIIALNSPNSKEQTDAKPTYLQKDFEHPKQSNNRDDAPDGPGDHHARHRS